MADSAVYKPELPYIVQVRIVLAAHPRKMMTLPQVGCGLLFRVMFSLRRASLQKGLP